MKLTGSEKIIALKKLSFVLVDTTFIIGIIFVFSEQNKLKNRYTFEIYDDGDPRVYYYRWDNTHCNFDEVFNSLSEETKRKVLYNLDLFR